MVREVFVSRKLELSHKKPFPLNTRHLKSSTNINALANSNKRFEINYVLITNVYVPINCEIKCKRRVAASHGRFEGFQPAVGERAFVVTGKDEIPPRLVTD